MPSGVVKVTWRPVDKVLCAHKSCWMVRDTNAEMVTHILDEHPELYVDWVSFAENMNESDLVDEWGVTR